MRTLLNQFHNYAKPFSSDYIATTYPNAAAKLRCIDGVKHSDQ